MCLLLVAHDCCPDYRLVLAANRDEFHDRPAAAAARWADHSGILGGRDLEAGGTWLALDDHGRFATITNVRRGLPGSNAPRSRGLIVSDFLLSGATAGAFTRTLAADADSYQGFNVLAYDGHDLAWYSNQDSQHAPEVLARDVYTLSNASLRTRWPKTERLRRACADVLRDAGGDPTAALLDALRDPHLAADDELPDTGIERSLEKTLSSIFIEGEHYGTRCSTVVLIDRDNALHFCERRYDRSGQAIGDVTHTFEVPQHAT